MFACALHEPVAVRTACEVQAARSSHAPHLLRYSVPCFLTSSQSFLVSSQSFLVSKGQLGMCFTADHVQSYAGSYTSSATRGAGCTCGRPPTQKAVKMYARRCLQACACCLIRVWR